MELSLEKIPDTEAGAKADAWIRNNIRLERKHADWYRDWAVGFGVPASEFEREVYPPAEFDTVNNFLWRICTYGSIVEILAGPNYAIEGPTGIWSRQMYKNVKRFKGAEGVDLSDKTLVWLRAHSIYDDHHPAEALELIKLLATTEEDKAKALGAAIHAMTYYAMAAEACYELSD